MAIVADRVAGDAGLTETARMVGAAAHRQCPGLEVTSEEACRFGGVDAVLRRQVIRPDEAIGPLVQYVFSLVAESFRFTSV